MPMLPLIDEQLCLLIDACERKIPACDGGAHEMGASERYGRFSWCDPHGLTDPNSTVRPALNLRSTSWKSFSSVLEVCALEVLSPGVGVAGALSRRFLLS
jgi:hypothetical protein